MRTNAFSLRRRWLSLHAPAAEPGGDLVVRIIAIALGISFLAGAIHGHRRDWKQG